jgi:putative membrane protein
VVVAAGPAAAAVFREEAPVAIGEIPDWIEKLLTPEDRAKVSEAVRLAERRTRGEIVPVIVRSSTPVRGVMVSTILFFIALFGFLEQHFSHDEPWSFVIALGLALILGFVFSQIPFVQRFFLIDSDERKCVMERAELEFYREGVHRTQERIGVLIFISLLERKVVILADQGVAEKLPHNAWVEVIERLVGKIRDGHLAEGLTRAIEECTELLAPRFPRLERDENELPNDLVLKE